MIFKKEQVRELLHDQTFFQKYYHIVLYVLMCLLILMIMLVSFVLYQVINRPLPEFKAIQKNGSTMNLVATIEPNFLSTTIIRFARKAATMAYTFDFVNYKSQLNDVKPFFTAGGWSDYQRSIQVLIDNIIANQLFVNGVVSGAPVISNQGPLPGKGFTWRVQIPFLVSYQSANAPYQRRFYVILTITKVPTARNPQGIGIDQFVMVQAV